MKTLVVIVTHNCSAAFEHCWAIVEPLLDEHVRACVVDNASTDPAQLQQLETLPTGVVTRLANNVGYGGAINHALGLSELELSGTARAVGDAVDRDARTATQPQPTSGGTPRAEPDYILCLNPDAYLQPDCLPLLIKAIEANETLASVAPLMLSAEDPAVIDGAGDVLSISGYAWRRWHGRRVDTVNTFADISSDTSLDISSSTSLNRSPVDRSPVFGACAGACLYRLSALREIGGFDPDYFMYVEDTDVALRLRMAGWSCAFVPKAVVHHEGSATTGYRSDFSVYHGHRNALRLLCKNFPLWLLPPSLALHLLASLLLLPRMAARGQLWVFLKAKWAGLLLMPAAFRARRDRKDRLSLPQWLSIFFNPQ